MIAALDTDALLELMWAAPLAVLVTTVSWALAIRGTTCALEAGRQGRSIPAALYALLAVSAGVMFAAAVVFGLLIMTSKD